MPSFSIPLKLVRTYKLGEEILTPFGRQQLCEYLASSMPLA